MQSELLKAEYKYMWHVYDNRNISAAECIYMFHTILGNRKERDWILLLLNHADDVNR
jgi:hypothetical protein